MDFNKNLELITEYLENLSNSKNERNELYIFITQNADQFLEITDRTVGEVKKIKDRHPNNWKELVVMTMFPTLQ
jgi:hypothetical protein